MNCTVNKGKTGTNIVFEYNVKTDEFTFAQSEAEKNSLYEQTINQKDKFSPKDINV